MFTTNVVPRLTAWRRQGVALGVYSSGSVEAQQLLFGHSVKGDLRWLFSHYFDTRVDVKRQSGRAAERRLSGYRC